MRKIKSLVRFAALFAVAVSAHAAQFTLESSGVNTWTYTLIFDSQDNYSQNDLPTTITMTGLFGVTNATAPTSTDFPEGLDATNLAWTPAILNGGTSVVWTILDGGTGNFGSPKHVYGFTLTAVGAVSGLVNVQTDNIHLDNAPTFTDRDINTTVLGPTGGGAAGATVPEPSSILLLTGGMGALLLRRKLR